MDIYVDADSCPVKEETYRVAHRYGLTVTLVAGTWLRVPAHPGVRLQVVKDTGALDGADDWIVEHVQPGDIVVTDDILLGSRCLEKGAHPLTPRGREFTAGTIGEAVALRELMANLRESGAVTGGPAPYTKSDRSEFLQRLDAIVQRVRRRQG